MVRRRDVPLTPGQELICELVSSGIMAALLHYVWDLPWWPQAILLGLVLGFGVWIVFVDIDWFHRGGGGGSSSNGSGGSRSGGSLFDIFD